MDFVHDASADGRPFRILTVVDQWSRSSPLLEVAGRMSGETVGAALDRVLGSAPRPRSITVDHGTEFQSRALEDWAYRRGVQLDFIRPGKPIENAFIESFNGRLRDECLRESSYLEPSDTAGENVTATKHGFEACRRPHWALSSLVSDGSLSNFRLPCGDLMNYYVFQASDQSAYGKQRTAQEVFDFLVRGEVRVGIRVSHRKSQGHPTGDKVLFYLTGVQLIGVMRNYRDLQRALHLPPRRRRGQTPGRLHGNAESM